MAGIDLNLGVTRWTEYCLDLQSVLSNQLGGRGIARSQPVGIHAGPGGDVVDQAFVENLERGDSEVKMIGMLMLKVDPKTLGGIAQIRVQYKSEAVY